MYADFRHDALTRLDHLRRGQPENSTLDDLRAAAMSGQLDWGVFPEVGGAVRESLRVRDARRAVGYLALAGVMVLAWGTLLPWIIGLLTAELGWLRPASLALLNPTNAVGAAGMASFLLACAIAAARRPLLSATAALMAFVPIVATYVADDPTAAGVLCRLLIVVLLGRALMAGMSFRSW